MPVSCCALGCSNSVLRGKRLFRIPLSEKDAARRQVWLAIIKREGFVPTAGSRFCEDHFEPDQFEQCRADGRKLLKCNAVPTIPGPGTLAGRKKRWRLNRRAPSATKRRRSSSVSVHGVLDGLLPALGHKISTMQPEDRHVALWMDRAAILPGVDPTLGGAGGRSSEEALVLTVVGLASCWKQTLGYHLLPGSLFFTSTALCSALKDVLFQVVERCEALGLTVDALVTDLSACSLSLWKQCGISTHPPFRRPVCSTRHPCSTEQSDHRRLMVLADVTYVTKSIIDALIENEVIFLPRDVVEKHCLPTDKVSFGHIRSLFAKNSADNLVLLRAVELNCLSPEYMRKDTSVSGAVLNCATVTGLRCLRSVELLPKEAETTAWFVEQINRWRSSMESVALDTKLEQNTDVAAFLHELKDTFARVSLASQTQEKGQLRGDMGLETISLTF
ncbi:uncharacterized protein LOC119186937 isoform X3 [Rhipicephalus microplus]|uniref:uncharacterized protein LOC119186937 isoform X3 n=1 Tax=Rhipicephalus microplus TaxID=6941 RepID=UPI003F6C51BB